MPEAMPRDLSTSQAAERLGLHVGTVRHLADVGELPHSRTRGGHRRFTEADILAHRRLRSSGAPYRAAARAEVWAEVADQLLQAAARDLRRSSELAGPFTQARKLLQAARAGAPQQP